MHSVQRLAGVEILGFLSRSTEIFPFHATVGAAAEFRAIFLKVQVEINAEQNAWSATLCLWFGKSYMVAGDDLLGSKAPVLASCSPLRSEKDQIDQRACFIDEFFAFEIPGSRRQWR